MQECGRGGSLVAAGRIVLVESEYLAAQGAAGALAGTGSVKRGPKAPPKDVRDTRIAELERETRRLQRKLTQAETIIGIQKKVATLLGIPLQSVDDDEHD